MDTASLVFLCFFLYPLVSFGILLNAAAVLNLLGKVEVIIDEFDSYVVTSVPFLKWKKRFDQGEVKAVEFGDEVHFVESQKDIKIIADRSVKFGFFLQSDRREWLRAALREVFFAKAPEWRLSNVSAPHWLARNPPHGRPEQGVGADSRQRPAVCESVGCEVLNFLSSGPRIEAGILNSTSAAVRKKPAQIPRVGQACRPV